MKPSTKTTGRKGLLVHPDDLQVGKHYAVHGIKNTPAETYPIFGLAFQLKAMNLPFLVGQLVSEPTHPALTFDVRHLDLMAVTKEYVEAQKPPVSSAN